MALSARVRKPSPADRTLLTCKMMTMGSSGRMPTSDMTCSHARPHGRSDAVFLVVVILNHKMCVLWCVCVGATGCAVPIGARVTNARSKFRGKCSWSPLGQPAKTTMSVHPSPTEPAAVPLAPWKAKLECAISRPRACCKNRQTRLLI